MNHALEVIAISAGAITGYELARRWFENRKGTNRRGSDPHPDNGPEVPE